jgi:hypothetical protein
MSRYKKNCEECKTDYKSNGPYSKYCSKECRQKARFKDRTYVPCLNCGGPTRTYKSNKISLCSNECKGEWMSKNSTSLDLTSRANEMRKHRPDDAWKKGLKTRAENGNIIDWNTAEWKQFWRRCDYLTRKIRKQMLENWNGYDYIDGEYIRDNVNLPVKDSNYPTLDHIKSKSQCFREGLTPEQATNPDNLKFTKRINNSRKHNK